MRSDAEERRSLAIRAWFLFGLLVLLFAGIFYRYLDLMVLRHEEFRTIADAERFTSQRLRGVRGTILDRHGRILAITRAFPSVAVDPSLVRPEEKENLATQLAAALELEPGEVLKKLHADAQFRWLRRRIEDPGVLDRMEYLKKRRGVIVTEDLVRCYPAGTVAGQLIGCTYEKEGEAGLLAGAFGVERSFNDVLTARPGCRAVLRDGRKGTLPLQAAGDREAPQRRDGGDVMLALDLTIQTFVEEALAKTAGEWKPHLAVAVVLDPANGDVLAMAGSPGYDPGHRNEAPPAVFPIRAVSSAFEVGSTIKPLIAADALDKGVVAYDDVIDCTEAGVWQVPGGRTVRDDHALGAVPFPEILIQSSNIGMAKVALELGKDNLYRHLRALGFGKRTGVRLAHETTGAGAVIPGRKWQEGWTLPSVGYGYEVQVSPLQFAAAFAALANGGYLYRPRLALRFGERDQLPVAVSQPVCGRVARALVLPALERVVTEGTGRTVHIPGYRIAGKTGTAQVRIGRETVGYNSCFAAIAPADAPRFVVFVLVHRARMDGPMPYGNRVAGPCVREILERCLAYAEIAPAGAPLRTERARAMTSRGVLRWETDR